jgi:hypothetical protein
MARALPNRERHRPAWAWRSTESHRFRGTDAREVFFELGRYALGVALVGTGPTIPGRGVSR